MDDVAKVFAKYGIPEWIWRPIMEAESGGNPGAVGDGGKSIGLFQINTSVHPYSPDELFDPVRNAEIAAQMMAPVWQEAQAAGYPPEVAVLDVWRRGIRPDWTVVSITGLAKSVQARAIALSENGGVPGYPSPDTQGGDVSLSFLGKIAYWVLLLILVITGIVSIGLSLTGGASNVLKVVK